MKIITCASYWATGSSAVTDLLSEFSNCSSVGDYEFRFLHDPDGIRDLEYNLVENNNRHNTDNAIKRYLKRAKFLSGNRLHKAYGRFMGYGENSFWNLTKDFIDAITELKCSAWWHYDQIERGKLFFYLDNAYDRLCKMLHFGKGRTGRYSLLELLNEPSYFSAVDRDTFYHCVKRYVNQVVGALNKENTEYVMIDQLLPPSNLEQYLNYFDDIRVVIVDRDPRDIFIYANEIIKEKVIPYQNAEDYCKWYEIIRRHRKREQYDPNKVILIQFEDLIYRYGETSNRLISFVGLDEKDHIAPKSRFDPDVSIANTNMSARFPKYASDVRYIEEHLEPYLYQFPG